MSPLQSFPVGSVVGASRWPYSSAHPDCWERPHRGIVLAINDPRAWARTLRFPCEPTQAEVDAYVARCQAQGILDDRVPVDWEFGKIYWESREMLRPYDEDVAEWEKARSEQALFCGM